MKRAAHLFASTLLCLASSLTPASAEPPARDPAVAQVLEMLGSGVSKSVVFRWVSAAGNAPEVITSEDVIALTRAGASDELLELLIDLAEKAPESLESVDRTSITTAPSPPPAPSAAVTEENPTAAAPTSTVATRFEIEYRPKFAVATEDPWDLYVYLDGEPLTWVSRGGQLKESPPVRFTRALGPGQHVLRLLVENHERRSGGRWFHQAQVAPTELVFRLAAGPEAEVGVRVAEPRFGLVERHTEESGPINVSVRQAGQVVLSLENAGGQVADWPELCEEIESNLDPAKKIPGRIEKALTRCVRWTELWRSLGHPAPGRDEARARLERFDYRLLAR